MTMTRKRLIALDLMLDVFEALSSAPALVGWNGLGLAVQAYQKRALLRSAGGHRIGTSIRTTDFPFVLVKARVLGYGNQASQEAGLAIPGIYAESRRRMFLLACARAMLAVLARSFPVCHPQRPYDRSHRRARGHFDRI